MVQRSAALYSCLALQHDDRGGSTTQPTRPLRRYSTGDERNRFVGSVRYTNYCIYTVGLYAAVLRGRVECK